MGMIDVSGCDVRELVRAAYDLSVPQGLGFLHYTPDSLSEEEIDEILAMPSMAHCLVNMDYVKGRACKFNVWQEGESLQIANPWYDHTDAQLTELLRRVGANLSKPPAEEGHGVACNCVECRGVRHPAQAAD